MMQSYKINNTNWSKFDNGNSIGEKGCENGVIIFDIEQIQGARITIEAECGNIPFVVTLGIYGILFHTEYFGLQNEAEQFVERKIIEIENILNLTQLDESKRNTDWEEKYFKLIDKITE